MPEPVLNQPTGIPSPDMGVVPPPPPPPAEVIPPAPIGLGSTEAPTDPAHPAPLAGAGLPSPDAALGSSPLPAEPIGGISSMTSSLGPDIAKPETPTTPEKTLTDDEKLIGFAHDVTLLYSNVQDPSLREGIKNMWDSKLEEIAAKYQTTPPGTKD